MHDVLPLPAVGAEQAWYEARESVELQDGRLHAVIHWLENSRAAAVEADDRSRRGAARGWLDGKLVGVKDNIDVAGEVTTAGAAFLVDNVAVEDAAVVRLLRRHGAVVHAKLNLAELAFGATTQNVTFGACRNPWDPHRIPGGSSGGSGAAIAAGYCDLALGTDTGASVRVPAALNGVVGLRPSFGTISTRGVLPASPTQDTVGPMARRAGDAAALTEALTAVDRDDPYSVFHDGAPATSRIGKPIDDLRVGVPESFFFDDLDFGVAAVIGDFLEWCSQRTTSAAPVRDFGAADAFLHWTRIVQCEAAAIHRERLKSRPADFSADVFARMSAGFDVSAVDLADSLHFRAAYRARLSAVFDDIDLIITPVVTVDVPRAEGPDSRAQTAALGRVTYPWALHEGPTLSLPIGFHPDSGMPVAVAISARRFGEAALFQLACAYQDETDWHTRRPSVATA